jgi:alpha-tubulin suppressor-like RCC1 family protein
VTRIACGGMHTLALAEGGVVFSWGVNDEGGLGRVARGGHLALQQVCACVRVRVFLPACVCVRYRPEGGVYNTF